MRAVPMSQGFGITNAPGPLVQAAESGSGLCDCHRPSLARFRGCSRSGFDRAVAGIKTCKFAPEGGRSCPRPASRRAPSGPASTSTSRKSLKEQGRSEDTAEEIAARTVNKERARHGESRTALEDLDPGPALLGRTRRPPLGHAAREGPHPRPALRRGEAQERQGSLAHEQGAAAASRRPLTSSGSDVARRRQTLMCFTGHAAWTVEHAACERASRATR